MTITKLAVKKMYATPIDVKLWNGNFNVASVTASNNKKRYELRYELSHEKLEPFSGERDKVDFIVWVGNSGVHEDIPDELLSLVTTLKAAATMSDEQAYNICAKNLEALREFHQNFYPC